jgi:hypothetical protein
VLSSTRLIVSAGYVLSLALTVLLSTELTARIEDRIRLGVPVLAAPSDEDLIVHDEAGVHGRPNARYKKWRLNSFGFRNGEMSVEPKPGCRRVMVLGASETFGYYESEGKEYPAQLATLLSRHGCYEVVNAAIVGMTVRTIGSFWDNWGSRFRPDTVVIYPTPAFYLGDVRPADIRLPGPVTKPIEKPVRWWTPRTLDRARDVIQVPAFLQRRRVSKWLEESRAGRPSGWLFEVVPEQRLRDLVSDVDLLACKVSATGARPVVVTHANGFHMPPQPDERDALEAWNAFTPRATASVLLQFERAAARELTESLVRHGIAVIDAGERMRGRREWFGGDLVHFSDEGASVVANLIADHLLRSPAKASHSARGCRAEPERALQ